MIPVPRRCGFALALVLACGSLAPSVARAEAPTKELRVPPAPAQDLADMLASLKSALPADLHPSFALVVEKAHRRLIDSERAAADGSGKRVSVDDASRAALLAADFAGVSKRKAKAVEAFVALTSLQVTFDLHAALRERVGHQLAVRAVRACGVAAACLDAIAPTTDMPAAQVDAVRRQLAGKTKDLEAADRLGNFEVQVLSTSYRSASVSRTKSSDKQQKAVMDFIKG